MKKDWKKKRRFRQSFARALQKTIGKPTKNTPYNGQADSFIIFVQEKYGDAILLTPLLKHIKRLFPNSTVTLLTFSKTTTAFFQSDPHVDTVHYAKANPIRYIHSVLLHRFDILFNTKDHPSTNFLIHSVLVPARCKIGIQNDYHTGIYDYLISIDFHSPIVLKNCGLLKTLGKEVHAEKCRPYIPPMPVSQEIQLFFSSLNEQKHIGINISAGGPKRYWTEENWKKFVTAFPDQKFIVFSAQGDHEQKKRLEQQCENIVPSPKTRNLYEASLIISRLSWLVTPDTAMVHVASCCKTGIIGLYSKALQDQSRFSPFLVEYRMISSPSELVKDIKTETVIENLKDILNRNR